MLRGADKKKRPFGRSREETYMDFVNGEIIHKQDKKDNIILINFKAH